MKHKLLSVCLALLLLAAFPLRAAAAEFDPDQLGSISVSLVSKEGNVALAGTELSVFHVASVKCNDEGKLVYVYTEHFADCGFPLDDLELISKLDAYVTGKNITCRKIVTDAQGKASCGDLPLGLYFVKQTGAVDGFAPCTPFLVTVPMESTDGYVYAVNASPKTEVAKLTSITIKKVWNTDASTKASDSVTVQLLRNGKVVETATLSENNNWQVTYTNLPESDAYSIKEVDVPKGFTATYKQNAYVFTVTNTSTLIQTGQLIWPIPVLVLVGVLLIAVGSVLLQKRGSKMRKWVGSICIILGVACLLAAVGFVIYNRWEAENAADITQSLLQDVQFIIDENKTTDPLQSENDNPSSEENDDLPEDVNALTEMATIKVDGYDCIGVLSIPVLELELPVLTDWSYTKLKKAPCHYYGSYYETDFVIAAHNYAAHFGRLSELQAGDLVVFTDVHGVAHCYEVVLLETLPPTATEAMITSGFDLSLYTCTPGGGSRVTVRCCTITQP